MKTALSRKMRSGRFGVATALMVLLTCFGHNPAQAIQPTDVSSLLGTSAAEQVLMLVPGIPGSSTVVGHTGWINVISFAGSAVAPATAGGAGAQPCQMVVQKPLDIASPHLWVATVTATIFTEPIRIQVLAPLGASFYVLYDIELTTAEITSIADSGSNALPLESVTLKAAKAIVTFNELDSITGLKPITASFTCEPFS